jgi:hypothetical protein
MGLQQQHATHQGCDGVELHAVPEPVVKGCALPAFELPSCNLQMTDNSAHEESLRATSLFIAAQSVQTL